MASGGGPLRTKGFPLELGAVHSPPRVHPQWTAEGRSEGEKPRQPEDGVARYDGGHRSENQRERDEALSASEQYSHKKFKKMESASEGGPGAVSPGVHPNLSLEALFQVTGHELEKIKLSSQDSDSSEQCATTLRSEAEGEDEEKKDQGKKDRKRRPREVRESSETEGPGPTKKSRLGRYTCQFCNLVCGKPSVLEKHIRAHTNERPYPCISCGIWFKTKSNLYKHRKSRTHHLREHGEADEVGTDESSNCFREVEDRGGATGEAEEMEDDNARARSVTTTLPCSNSSCDEGVIKVTSSYGVLRTTCGSSPEGNVPLSPSFTSRTLPVGGVEEKRPGMMAVTPTSIYKPKFHSVPYDIPSDNPNADSVILPVPTRKPEGEPASDGTVQTDNSKKGGRAATVNGGCSSATSLAKRRNDHFQLRLEIPRPRAPPALFPGCSSSSSSCSTSSRSAASPTVAASRPEPVANGDCLPVSAVASGSGHASTGHGGEALCQTLKSPKLTSPEDFQQRINKLISQNAAIVETFDPLWPRRYTRQNSVASSHNVDAELGGSKERLRRYSEDVTLLALPTKSKLALALLANPGSQSAAEARDGPRSASSGAAMLGGAVASTTPTSLAAVGHRSLSLPKEAPLHEEQKNSAKEGDGGSIVRSLLLVDSAKRSKSSKSEERATSTTDAPHPQNPEGSIIKDLLLKTRSAGRASQGPSLATCMRLSGGSVSAPNAPAEIDRTGVGSSPTKESLFPGGEFKQRSDSGGSAMAVYSCSTCNISYRKMENLEAHRSRYCPSYAGKVIATATSGGSFSLPANTRDSRGGEDSMTSGIVTGSGKTAVAGQEALASTSELLCQKPRGRPRGSKNRPKMEAVSLGIRSAPKVLPRIHSKSVSESSGELQARDKTIDALKGKLRYRRNSVSGNGAADSPNKASVSRNTFTSLLANADGEERTALVIEEEGFESWQSEKSVEDGPILKKHLLGGDRSPPLKKRKGSDQSVDAKPDGAISNGMGSTVLTLKSLEHLSKYPMRPSAIHLFGGEVQICDGAETKKIVIDSKIQSMSPGSFLGGVRAVSESTTSSVVATIAKPVHNSGGTVLQVQASTLVNKPVCIPVVSIGRPLMATGSENPQTSLTGSIVLQSPKPVLASQQFSIDISHLKLLNPNPILDRAPSFASSSLPPSLVHSPNFHIISDTASKMDDTGSSPNEAVSLNVDTQSEVSRAHKVPIIAVHSPRSPTVSSDNPLPTRCLPVTTASGTLLSPARPTTLALKSTNTTSSVGMTLVSPETPRPKKKYGQCYHNGQYYTYLEFKQSTRVYYCNCRPQPMYVPQSVDPRLSMYSMWQTVPATPDPFGLSPPQAMSLYCSKSSSSAIYSMAKPAKTHLVLTHSSYWTFQQKGKDDVTKPLQPPLGSSKDVTQSDGDTHCEVDAEEVESDISSQKGVESEEDDNEGSEEGMTSRDERPAAEGKSIVENTPFKGEISLKHRLKDAFEIGIHEPKRVKIFEGGFKSNEDYTYVRGRGRGKYVCEDCGIRCKKPSMLKKHIRTHNDVRPYTCKQCTFSFKTKGNLTKHMKSKTHHKKCVELGIVPVPVTIDDAQIDEEALERQERIEHQRKQFADVEEDSNLEEDEDDEDDDDDEYYDQVHEEYKEGEDEDDESVELEGQFDDANEVPLSKIVTMESNLRKGCPEQEIAHSLLDLGKPDNAVGSPSPILSLSHFDSRVAMNEVSYHHRPTMSTMCHVLKRDSRNDDREELIGNPRVAWASCQQDVEPGHHDSDIATQSNVYEASYDEMTERAEKISVGSNSRERVVLINPSVDNRNMSDQAQFIPQPVGFVATGNDNECVYAPHSAEQRSNDLDSANDECDQPIDLSMPHSRCDQPEWDDDDIDDDVEDDDEDDVEEDEDDDEDEIVVDDDDAGEKVGPYYCAYPEFEDRRLGKVIARETILPTGSGACQEKGAALSPSLQSPLREEGSEGNRVTSKEWAEKQMGSPQCSVLHSYLSDQAAAKRVSIEVVATVSRHRSSVTSFGDKDSFSVALPSTHSTRPPLFGYPASPQSHLDAQYEPSSPKLPPDRMPRLPSTSFHNMPQYIHRSLEDDKCICTICNKAFNKPSQLRLHVNIHYFERPFRCDSCAISFRTKGHLQKHKRSVSHYNKVNMNMTFGTPTTDNPRPFKCGDCKIAFRIHGHLAKHLRSKMHIMKLECLGKLPFGTYAEIERSGANLNEIDTTDCENSLESLQVMAHRLVDKVAVPQHWPRERTISGGSCDDQSDGVPFVESPLPSSSVTSCTTNVPRQCGSNRLCEDGCASPDFTDSDHLVSWSRKSFDGDMPPLPLDASDAVASLPSAIKCESNDKRPLTHLMNSRAKTVLSTVIRTQDDKPSVSSQRTRSVGSLMQEYEDISDEDVSEMESNKHNTVCFSCCKCGKRLKSAKSLQLHMYVDHPDTAVTTSEASNDRMVEMDALSSSILHSSLKRRRPSSPLLSISLATSTTITAEGYVCQLCGDRFTSSYNLKQHMLVHAQFRPFVCGICDAGFTNSHLLKLHSLQSHQQGKSFACQECNLVFGVSEDLKHHVNHNHPAIDGDHVR